MGGSVVGIRSRLPEADVRRLADSPQILDPAVDLSVGRKQPGLAPVVELTGAGLSRQRQHQQRHGQDECAEATHDDPPPPGPPVGRAATLRSVYGTHHVGDAAQERAAAAYRLCLPPGTIAAEVTGG